MHPKHNNDHFWGFLPSYYSNFRYFEIKPLVPRTSNLRDLTISAYANNLELGSYSICPNFFIVGGVYPFWLISFVQAKMPFCIMQFSLFSFTLHWSHMYFFPLFVCLILICLHG